MLLSNDFLFGSAINLHSDSGDTESKQLEVLPGKDSFGGRYSGFSKCEGICAISIG